MPHRPLAIVDDTRVVAAMREAGYPVLHADWERRDAEEQLTLERAQEQEGRT